MAAAIAPNPQGAGAPDATAVHPPLLEEPEVPPLLDEPVVPLLDPAPELLLDEPPPELPLEPPLLLELPALAPPSKTTKVHVKFLHVAPCAWHLQSVSTVHHPADCAADIHISIG